MRTVNVVDTVKPLLTLVGSASMSVECHGSFTDPGATATDSCVGESDQLNRVSGTVDANAPGTYTLRYNVTDPSGNSANELSRTVEVVDSTAPTIAGPLANLRVCTSSNSATVTFATPAATTRANSAPTITVAPTSGSSFPLGVTT